MNDAVVGVKICGVTCIEDALVCADAGVDWVGLNFHPASPRFVEPSRAKEIVGALPAALSPVGVFVDRPPEEVAELAGRVGLKIVQLHGHEPPEDLRSLSHLWLIRAFRLRQASDWSEVIDYLAEAQALGRMPDAVLVDTYVAGQPGGTGMPVSSDVLDVMPPLPRLILAGGLTSENVAARAVRVQAWMVDAASGVESAPGRKDPAKVAAFVQSARSAVCWGHRPHEMPGVCS
jgi:phosphoribosylanthranilate isomerase